MKKYAAIILSLMIIMGASASVAGAQPLTYTVQSGDSLWKIANQYGLSVDKLKSINNLKNDNLQIGQVLKLSNASSPQAAPVSTLGGSTYVIQSGDCLGSIAIKYGMSVDELKALNGLQTDLIQAGKTLLVKNTAVASSSPASIQAPAPASAASNTPTTVTEQQYVLQPGDSLYSVAENYGLSVSYLMQINNLQSDILDAGVTLRILPEPVPVSRSGAPEESMRILKTAAQYLGTPYKYGGNGPGGFDCSGFAQYVFKQSGYNLPRTASGQYGLGTAVAKSNLQPGDMVFFACYSSSVDHVGIYSGSGQFIHSSSPRSGGVIYSSLSEDFYARTYVGAKRIIK